MSRRRERKRARHERRLDELERQMPDLGFPVVGKAPDGRLRFQIPDIDAGYFRARGLDPVEALNEARRAGAPEGFLRDVAAAIFRNEN